MTDAILVLNAGSSSIKFAAYPIGKGENPPVAGLIERIGGDAKFTISSAPPRSVDSADHPAALALVAAAVTQDLPDTGIAAVSHRIVHGGARFSAPIVLDADSLHDLDQLVPLAPLHQPHGLQAVRTAQSLYPGAAQIACFDTAFHATKPWLHDSYALPHAHYDEGLRRYGFHGLSCQSILRTLHAEDYPVATRRIVIAHLGNGCSATAVLNGRGHATSMGFSTLDGLIMGTRCGQLDPGVILYWLRQGKTRAEIEDILYKRSGLLGLSGRSNDMRDLTAAQDPAADAAIEAFVMRAVEEICRLTGTMGGLDTLVFCGGIGENATLVRDRIVDGLGFLPGRSGSGIDVLVRETREEHEMMLAARSLLETRADQIVGKD
ncbi:MAG: acetate/propionate family kinase [Pseudomonadota bacterium]